MKQQNLSVLYDAPGPRARRVSLIASLLIAILLVVVLYFLVYRPLNQRGELSMEKWGPLINPNHPEFQPLWEFLGGGFRATLIAAVLAIASSLVFGTALAVLRIQLKALQQRRFAGLPAPVAIALRLLSRLLNVVTRICVEVLRGTPVVISIFFASVVLPDALGISPGQTLLFLVIGLTVYNMVVIGEILRSGMQGLPGGQREAAHSIGLTPFQTTRMVLLPQAYRIMLPALISQLVVILKDTSLGFIIGYEETLATAKLAIPALTVPNTIQMYTVIGAIYIAVNYALSKLAQYVQRRMARSRRTGGTGPVAAPPSVTQPDGSAAVAIPAGAAPGS